MIRTVLLPSVLIALLVLAGCSADPSGDAAAAAQEQAPAWPIHEESALSIGVVDGDERYQMHQVVGAARLGNGNIAVMNSGSSQLRIYSPDGMFIAAHGRQGEGPGEFRQASRLHLIGDTIFVYDGRLRRQSLHDQTGAFIENRSLQPAPGRFQLDDWLYERSWIDGPPFGVGRAPVKAAVRQLPEPDSIDVFRYVRVSPWGHLWVREHNEPDAPTIGWHIYDMNARAIGRVELPGSFEVFDFGPDYLLGRMRDDLDVEYVRMFDMEPAIVPRQRMTFTGSPTDTTREMAADTAFTDQRQAMVGSLRMLTGSQEIYYSTPENRYRYATDTSQLEGFEAPEGVAVRIVTANERGWNAIAMDRASGRMCGVAIGFAAPPGWTPGVVSCQ